MNASSTTTTFAPHVRPWRRWILWLLLVALVIIMLAITLYLAARYEASQVQAQIEQDTAEAVTSLRSGLNSHLLDLQSLASMPVTTGQLSDPARTFLLEHRSIVRLVWRDARFHVTAALDTPLQPGMFTALTQQGIQTDSSLTCANARRFGNPAYSSSFFVPKSDGLGVEMIELCIPIMRAGTPQGYLLAIYALPQLLADLAGNQITRHQEISFMEADGTRLAMHGTARRGQRLFRAQQLLDLPGNTLVVRIDSWHSAPNLLPNVMSSTIMVLTLALLTVLVLLARDTRKRWRVEHDLADALAFRKAMEDSLVTGLRARDLEGRITYVNPAFCDMVGFSAQELWGHGRPAPYWPSDLVEEYEQRQAVRLAATSAPREGFESVFVRKNGQRFPVLIIEAPLINAQGLHTGWMGAVLDLSEQRRMEEMTRASLERLQASARLTSVGEMASLLSHELNQPLAAISSYAVGSLNLLQHQPELPASELKETLKRISQQAERAGQVIKSVHDFVRRRPPTRESVSVDALLQSIWPLLSLYAQKNNIRLIRRIPAGLHNVLCDRTMVEQVLLNLARNGMQAMESQTAPPPLLTISAEWVSSTKDSEHPWIEIRVQDQGCGISDEVGGRLFTPFFSTKPEGMGLGLSLCRTVIEQHGGHLWFEPALPKGTVFKFTLPCGNG